MAKVHCAYIDGRQRIFGGLVYDHQRRFPVHAAHPSDTSLGANSRYDNMVRFKKLSHNLAVYPFATAHTFERLPRLFLLIKALPEVSSPPAPLPPSPPQVSPPLLLATGRAGAGGGLWPVPLVLRRAGQVQDLPQGPPGLVGP